MALKPTDSSDTVKSQPTLDTKPSAEDEVLIREIDEAVRQDDAAQFMQKYGLVLGGAVVLVLASLGGYLFWDSQVESGLEQQSETMISALDSIQANELENANETIAPLLSSDEAGARTAARLLQAGTALEQEKFAEAAEHYAAVAADPDAPPALRDLALIREVASTFDEREPADVIAKLEQLAVPGNAFFGSAAELTAIAHLEAGNRSEAGNLFAQISKDEELPETLRSRARQMAGLLGVDAIEDVEQLLEDEGAVPSEGSDDLPGGSG